MVVFFMPMILLNKLSLGHKEISSVARNITLLTCSVASMVAVVNPGASYILNVRFTHHVNKGISKTNFEFLQSNIHDTNMVTTLNTFSVVPFYKFKSNDSLYYNG